MENKIGNTNDVAAFSFYANKNITTGGEGGAVSTNNPMLADKLRILSLHGMDKDGWSRFKNNGRWSYDISLLGYKYNLTDIASSIGINQLKNANKWQKRRLDISNQYFKGLKSVDGIELPPKANDISKHANHLFIIQINKECWSISRNDLIIKLNKLGIGTSVHYRPIHMHSYYVNKYGFKADDFKKSKNLFENVISIPLYPDLKKTEISYIIDSLNELWYKYSK
jgi:dTDP-4-amino-4,6-dideoxygalactose transaminase